MAKNHQIHKLAIGHGSALDMLERGIYNVSMTAMSILLWMNAKESNETGRITYTEIANVIKRGVSTISRWFEAIGAIPLSDQNHRSRNYVVASHYVDEGEEIPVDKRGNAKRCYVPSAVKNAFEDGKISDVAFVVRCWLQRESHWTRDSNYGLSRPIRQTEIAKACRINPQRAGEALKELTKAGLIERLTAKNQIGVYQMLPKLEPVKKPEKTLNTEKTKEGHHTAKHTYSDNRQYRMNRITGDIEKRRGKRKWTAVRDREFHLIPKAILTFFNTLFERNRMDLAFERNRMDLATV